MIDILDKDINLQNNKTQAHYFTSAWSMTLIFIIVILLPILDAFLPEAFPMIATGVIYLAIIPLFLRSVYYQFLSYKYQEKRSFTRFTTSILILIIAGVLLLQFVALFIDSNYSFLSN